MTYCSDGANATVAAAKMATRATRANPPTKAKLDIQHAEPSQDYIENFCSSSPSLARGVGFFSSGDFGVGWADYTTDPSFSSGVCVSFYYSLLGVSSESLMPQGPLQLLQLVSKFHRLCPCFYSSRLTLSCRSELICMLSRSAHIISSQLLFLFSSSTYPSS